MKPFNFYKSQKAYGELYLQFPRAFLYSETYSQLSDSAKIGYMIFRDRVQHSLKNNWIDEDDNIYFIFTNDELCELLNKSKPTAVKIKRELEEKGLLLQKQMGFDPISKKNYPNRLYLADLELCTEDTFQLQKQQRTLISSGSKNSLPRHESPETLKTSGSKKFLLRQKASKTLDTSGSKKTLLYLYKDLKDIKDFKDIKDSSAYHDQNQRLETGVKLAKQNTETENDLINHFILEKNIEGHYGRDILQNFKKYSRDFDTFKTFYEKLYFSHQSVEIEKNFKFTLHDAVTFKDDEYKNELSKTFWKCMHQYRSGQVKKSLNDYLFSSFKRTFSDIAEDIILEKNTKYRGKKVPMHNWLEGT